MPHQFMLGQALFIITDLADGVNYDVEKCVLTKLFKLLKIKEHYKTSKVSTTLVDWGKRI